MSVSRKIRSRRKISQEDKRSTLLLGAEGPARTLASSIDLATQAVADSSAVPGKPARVEEDIFGGSKVVDSTAVPGKPARIVEDIMGGSKGMHSVSAIHVNMPATHAEVAKISNNACAIISAIVPEDTSMNVPHAAENMDRVQDNITAQDLKSPGQDKSLDVSSGQRLFKDVLNDPHSPAGVVEKDVSSSSSSSKNRKTISRPSRKGGVRICLPVPRARSPSPPPPAVNYSTRFNMEAARAVAEQSRAENIFMPGFTFPAEESDNQDDDDDAFDYDYDERCHRRPGLHPRGVLRRTHSWDDFSLEF